MIDIFIEVILFTKRKKTAQSVFPSPARRPPRTQTGAGTASKYPRRACIRLSGQPTAHARRRGFIQWREEKLLLQEDEQKLEDIFI
jgi:hypothetical protein